MDLPDALSSSSLEIHLLGRFTVYVDGHELPESSIKGRKARSLLKLLAHQRQHQMVRDQAVEVLWPELNGTAAASQLYKAIHHIRKAIGSHMKDAEEWIEITDNLIRIAPPGGLVTDLNRFGDMARTGLRSQNINKLEMAASLYTGDFLPMDRYADWGTLPREHYRQLYLDVLTTLARQYEQQGDLSEAAEMLRLALEKEPALETAHRGLMRVFARQGQITRSFRQYDVCREVLREELGMSPTSETRKILDDIREGRLSGKEDRAELKATIPGLQSPIVGRTKECAVIDRLLDRLSDGEGGALLISGEVGTGKTRLARELIFRARRKELSFFLGRTKEGTGPVAYGPFSELFGDVLHKEPELESSLPVELGRLIPGFSGGGTPVPHADKLAAKGYLFARVHQFFAELSEAAPLVVILEDLHAADKGSRELFSYLMQHQEKLPVLFVATIRKEADEPLPDILSGQKDDSVEILNLEPLTFDEHINLLHHYAPAEVEPGTARHIFRLSEGNPLFGLELLRFYSEKEQPDPEQKLVSDASTGSLIPEPLPDSLRMIVKQKLDRLSPPAHHLLYIAAVIGRQVPYELMASVWNNGDSTEENVLFDALEEVIRARLLEESGLDYSFRHTLVREAVYASISGARRKALHGLVARRLVSESEEKEPVEQIAYHFIRAGDVLQGVHYLILAGERAEKAYAHDDALQRYREACDVLEEPEDNETKKLKCEILERTGDVYRACGRLEKSYDAYNEAITLAEKTPLNKPGLVELYRKMAVVAIFRTETDLSEQYLLKAFELNEEEPRAQARLFITKALHLWHLNQLEKAYEVAKKALEKANKSDATAEASQACEILAMTCLPLGRWEEGLEYELQRQLYGWSPDIVVAIDAHLCLWEYHVSGDQPLQQARSFMEQVSEQASKTGNLRCVAVCHYALGTMHLWRGQRRLAVDELSSSLELHERVGSPAGMAYALARKSVLHTLMGAADLGWQAVQQGLLHAKQAAVRDHCLQRLYGVGIWNRLEAGDTEGAGNLVAQSEQLLENTGACAACALELYPWLAYFYLQTGDIAQAQKCGDAVSELAAKTGNPIGKSIASMITSSLHVTEQNEQQARQYNLKSFEILKDEVSEATYSPVIHYLERMVEQQAELRGS
ncbi:MAG: AAA family ATPase [Balneolaceae bacterium]